MSRYPLAFQSSCLPTFCDSFVREETHRELRNTTTFVFLDGRLTTNTWFGVHVTKASLPVYTTTPSTYTELPIMQTVNVQVFNVQCP